MDKCGDLLKQIDNTRANIETSNSTGIKTEREYIQQLKQRVSDLESELSFEIARHRFLALRDNKRDSHLLTIKRLHNR